MTAPAFTSGWYRIASRQGTLVRWCEIDMTSPGRASWIAAYLTRDLAGDPHRAEFLMPLDGFLRLNAVRIETEAT